MEPPALSCTHNSFVCKRCSEGGEAHCGQSEGHSGILPGRQIGMPALKMKQDCVTRWNSTFHMLKRILACKEAIISTLAVINAHVAPLCQEEWEVLQEAGTVLEPFEQVTVEISA